MMAEMSPTELEAKLFSGMAGPKWLALLKLLQTGPRTPGELAPKAVLTPSGSSNHVRCLLERGLVSVESEGRFNRYRLAEVGVGEMLLESERVLAKVREWIEARHDTGHRHAERCVGMTACRGA